MNLKYKEKFLLLLYWEYFDREYNIDDNREWTAKNNRYLVRHIEMQNIAYLMEKINFALNGYGFCWHYYGPGSDNLNFDLNKLDQQEEEIKSFYEECYGKGSTELLCEYCRSCIADKIEKSSTVLQDSINTCGIMMIGGILYLYNTVLPGREKESILSELKVRFETYGITVNEDDFNKIWQELSIIGLIETPVFRRIMQKKN